MSIYSFTDVSFITFRVNHLTSNDRGSVGQVESKITAVDEGDLNERILSSLPIDRLPVTPHCTVL